MESTESGPGANPGPTLPASGDTSTVAHIPVRPKHLSPTSASMFRQCPRRWKFRYVDRLPDPPGEAALAGTFAHRVLEELLGLEPQERTMDRARACAKEVWSDMAVDEDFNALALDTDGIRNFKWTAWRAIEGLWDLEDPTTVEVVDTETEVSVEIGGVPFVGYIDRVEAGSDGLVISDYQVGASAGPEVLQGTARAGPPLLRRTRRDKGHAPGAGPPHVSRPEDRRDPGHC